jgi:endonuclease-3
LKNCGAVLVEEHQGEVPASLEQLVELPGIGRKTANVILGAAFNIPGIVVDTHVGRITKRIGLTQEQDPVKIEFDLMEIIPKDKWTVFSHQLIQHGRKICNARKPKCTECPLLEHCDYGQQTIE